jgi:hypothetical protein
MRQSEFRTSFNVGELGPDAWSRSDLAQHGKGCLLGFNFIGRVAGPAGRRPGTWHVGAPKHHDKAARLIPFRRSQADALMLEFGHLYVRVWSVNGTPVMDGPAQVEFASPFTEAQLAGIRHRQSGDLMYLTHADGVRTQTLTRTSNTSWAIAPTVFTDGPWRPENVDEAKTLTLSGASLTATGHAPFTAQHVGALFRLRKNDGNPGVKSWEPDEQDVPDNDRRLSNGRVYTRTGGINDTGNTPPVHDRGKVLDGKAEWTFLHDGAGVVRITAVSSSTQATVQALTGMPDGLDAGTFNWAEGAYSDARGWPTAPPVFREERLALAASPAEPDAIDFTRTAGFNPAGLDFKPGLGTGRVVDDDAVRRFVGDERNRIVWMEPTTYLLVGTTSGEFVVTGGTVDDPISPSGCVARGIGDYGSADVPPVVAWGSVMFVAAGGETLRTLEMGPDQALGGRDLMVTAGHIGARGLAELAWMKQPWNLLWVRLSDGGQATFSHHAEQQVEGWNRQGLAAVNVPTEAEPLGGGLELESLCVVPGARGKPRLFLLAKRTKVGQPQRMILRLAEPGEKLFLDAAEAYAGPAVNAVAGLGHLAGEAVTVMAGTAADADPVPGVGWGMYRGRVVDEDGEVALPEGETAGAMQAGLPYLSRWESLPPDMLGPGTTQGRKVNYKTIHWTLDVAEAEVGTTGDEGDAAPDPILSRRPGDVAGPVLRRLTGRSALPGGAERGKRWFVQTTGGWDLVVHMIRPSADVDG